MENAGGNLGTLLCFRRRSNVGAPGALSRSLCGAAVKVCMTRLPGTPHRFRGRRR